METTENTTNELIIRIEEKYAKMSKGQRRLADYICQNYDKAVFLTAAKLGEIVGVTCPYKTEFHPANGGNLRQNYPERDSPDGSSV